VDQYLGSRYELVEVIGAGASGQVWRARLRKDTKQLRKVRSSTDIAAKILRGDLAGDPGVVERFIKERSLLMSLEHPAIVHVIEVVAEGDRLAIVMELMPGGSLANRLSSKGTLAQSDAVHIVQTILEALAYAHSKGILHRDVKPANILLGSAEPNDLSSVKLSDFGIASLVDEDGLRATDLIGSPAYMSPELFASGIISAASDVYAAGITLYELLAGRTPFAGSGSAHTVGLRHVAVPPPRLPIDPRLWTVIESMLAKDPADRLSAIGAANALKTLHRDVTACDPLPVQEDPKWEAISIDLPRRATVQTLDAVIDLGQTRLSGLKVEEPSQLVTAGDIERLIAPAHLEGNSDLSMTRLAAIDREQARIEQRPAAKARNIRAIIVIVCIALVACTGGGFLVWKSGLFSSKRAPSKVQSLVPAHHSRQPYATGLRIDLDASPSKTVGAIDLTLTLTAPRSTGLSGDILLVIPSDDNSSCPVLSGAALLPVTQTEDGVAVSCATKFNITLAASQSMPMAVQVQGNLGNDLQKWLDSIIRQSDQAISQITGQAFSLQRVIGLTVQADSVTRDQTLPPVSYRVFAEWVGGHQELFRNDTLAFQATDLLKSLTGGSGLDGVTVSSCPETQVHGIVVLAQQPANSCFIQVTIGDLTSPKSSFVINTSGS